ncbi:ROK family protein [Kribbella aluminosa]|uniref:ROK family protein n=1 Tax=Kribbella aluminosa TaxID=416017 RepID=UPI0031D50C6D
MMTESGLLTDEEPLDNGTVARAGAGRPERPLTFSAGTRAVLGVHVRENATTVTAYDLRQRPLATARAAHRGRSASAVLRGAARLTQHLIDVRLGRLAPSPQVLGVGLSVGGTVDFERGTLIESPQLGWHDVDLAGPFADFDVPVLIDSSVRALAVRQLWDADDPVGKTTVTIFVAGVVAAALIVDRRLLRGPGASAGDIRHLPVRDGLGLRCWCGRTDCLGVTASNRALYDHAVARGLLDPSVRWQSRVGEGYVDTPALAALRRRRAGWLGEAIATTIELVDPDTTVIFGYLGTDDDVRNCLSIIDARCAATLDGRQGRVLHRDSPASIWDAASAALVLDDFLCRPTRYDRSLLT